MTCEAGAYLREQINHVSNASTKYMIRQGVPNHIAVLLSYVFILLVTINLPLVLVALAFLFSVLMSFVFGTVAVLSGALLSFAITAILGFSLLAAAMGLAFAGMVLITALILVSSSFALFVSLAAVAIGMKMATASKKVNPHLSINNHGSAIDNANSNDTSYLVPKKVLNPNHVEQNESTIVSEYSGSG